MAHSGPSLLVNKSFFQLLLNILLEAKQQQQQQQSLHQQQHSSWTHTLDLGGSNFTTLMIHNYNLAHHLHLTYLIIYPNGPTNVAHRGLVPTKSSSRRFGQHDDDDDDESFNYCYAPLLQR